MNYIWTEDSRAGFHYWQLFNQYLLSNSFEVCSKENNQKLLEAVRDIPDDTSDVFYIAFDTVFDNMDIVNKYLELKTIAEANPEHIILIDLTCFEEIILKFSRLISWTNTGKKDKIVIRNILLNSFGNHKIDISMIDDEMTLRYLRGFKRYSTERVLKSITAEITGKDEWSIKGIKLGNCWCKDCCNIEKNSCGIHENMSGDDKIMELLNDEVTQRIFNAIIAK